MYKRIRVLIADDFPFYSRSLGRIFESARDVEVLGQVCNADEVLPNIAKHNPHVLLLDLSWYDDEEAGIRLIRPIKEVVPHVFTVALSGHERLLEKARQENPDCVMAKNFTAQQLLAVIRDAADPKEFCRQYAEYLDHELPDGNNQDHGGFVCSMLSYLLAPHLTSAKDAVRSLDGEVIKDIVFHNDGEFGFWRLMREQYDAGLVVVECKNTLQASPSHVDQLASYLDSLSIEKGIGLLVTRKPLSGTTKKRVGGLFKGSGRKVILALSDDDLYDMLNCRSRGEDPSDVLWTRFRELDLL